MSSRIASSRRVLTMALALGAFAIARPDDNHHSLEVGQCQFANEPVGVGSFWDPTCANGMLGCLGDGHNMECRLCGSGDFSTVPCPPSSCKFPNEPAVSYFWDPQCRAGMQGCWGDGVHAQCRFCGTHPYTNITCPEGAAPPRMAACSFVNEPETPYYFEPGCTMGKHGCNADGKHVKCRFCGMGDYADVPCAASQVCDFEVDPMVPYFWDPKCKNNGGLGCNADGIHQECRFCSKQPFEDIPCPGLEAPPQGVCVWPLRGEPMIPTFWDKTCKKGMLGCWADGMHAECRFCGEGVFSEVACPDTIDLLSTGFLRH